MDALSIPSERPHPYSAAITNDLLTAVLAFVAFFFGGWMAAGMSGVRALGSGLSTGFIVWALGITFMMTVSALGAGLVFGAAGDMFSQFGMSSSSAAPQVTTMQVASSAGTTAAWGLLFLVPSCTSALMGGWAGSAAPAGVSATERPHVTTT